MICVAGFAVDPAVPYGMRRLGAADGGASSGPGIAVNNDVDAMIRYNIMMMYDMIG